MSTHSKLHAQRMAQHKAAIGSIEGEPGHFADGGMETHTGDGASSSWLGKIRPLPNYKKPPLTVDGPFEDKPDHGDIGFPPRDKPDWNGKPYTPPPGGEVMEGGPWKPEPGEQYMKPLKDDE